MKNLPYVVFPVAFALMLLAICVVAWIVSIDRLRIRPGTWQEHVWVDSAWQADRWTGAGVVTQYEWIAVDGNSPEMLRIEWQQPNPPGFVQHMAAAGYSRTAIIDSPASLATWTKPGSTVQTDMETPCALSRPCPKHLTVIYESP